MKKLLLAFTAIIGLFSAVSCLPDPPPPQPKNWEGTLVQYDIDSNTTWYSDSIYTIRGRIAVKSGSILTIQPGCIIKGEPGSGANASCLIVAQGGKIYAIGTPNAPIIFTSTADSIQPGMIASPNLSVDNVGLWGGLIICGYAPISTTIVPVQIEGIPVTDISGLYGGTDSLDNSGALQYVSIRHGGTNIGQGNEINGLTLGGVGFLTMIDHVEVVANQDDGIEIFGGNVGLRYGLVWGQQDDAFDVDQAYHGLIRYYVSIANGQRDHALELDGPEGSWNKPFTLLDGWVIDSDTAQFDFRDNARGQVSVFGTFQAEHKPGTNVTIDTLFTNPIDVNEFSWTWAHAAGKI